MPCHATVCRYCSAVPALLLLQQGREKDVVIFSCVRTAGEYEKRYSLSSKTRRESQHGVFDMWYFHACITQLLKAGAVVHGMCLQTSSHNVPVAEVTGTNRACRRAPPVDRFRGGRASHQRGHHESALCAADHRPRGQLGSRRALAQPRQERGGT